MITADDHHLEDVKGLQWSSRDFVLFLLLGVDCGEPCSVSNSTEYRDAATLYTDVISYECDAGFENTGGPLNRTCLHNSKWSGDSPKCTSRP